MEQIKIQIIYLLKCWSECSFDWFPIVEGFNFKFQACHFNVQQFQYLALLDCQGFAFFCKDKIWIQLNFRVYESGGEPKLSQMCVHRMWVFGKSLETFIKNDGLGSYCSTSGVFWFFKWAKDQLALLLCFISEEQSDMTFQELGQSMWMGFKAGLLVSSQGNSEDTVLAHHELAVSQFLLETFEVISWHVIEWEDIQKLVLCHKRMDSINNEFFVLSGFRFSLGQGD